MALRVIVAKLPYIVLRTMRSKINCNKNAFDAKIYLVLCKNLFGAPMFFAVQKTKGVQKCIFAYIFP